MNHVSLYEPELVIVVRPCGMYPSDGAGSVEYSNSLTIVYYLVWTCGEGEMRGEMDLC